MHLALLVLTLAALASGPLLYVYARPRPALLALLDGFMLISIAGLVLLEAVPGTFSAGGVFSVLFLLLGLLGPTAMEHWISRARREAHLTALALAMLGLIVHSLGDGVALSAGGHDHHHEGLALPIAVAVHSVPVGLAVWWLLYPVFGVLAPALAIVGMCASTLLGYGYGPLLGAELGTRGWAWFQALVAGSILHVVFGRPHLNPEEHALHPPLYEGIGNLLALAGIVVLAWIEHEPLPAAAFFNRTLQYAAVLAPVLLALDLLASVIVARRHTRGAYWAQVLRLATVELVDRSAVWLVAGLLLAALLLPLLAPTLSVALQPNPVSQAALALMSLLLAGSLLRRGGRGWLADLLPRSAHHGHDHDHSH